MSRLSWAIVALVALVLGANPPAPARQAAAGTDKLTAQVCAEERKQDGRRAFDKRYGERDAMRACVRRARRKVRVATGEAERLCRQELAELGPEQFAEEWGTDESGSDAEAECVAYTLDSLLRPSSGGEDGGGEEEEEDFA